MMMQAYNPAVGLIPQEVNPRLATTLGDLPLNSVIMNASGAFNPAVFSRMFPLKYTLGALVSKTVTPNASAGNPQQRTVELPGIGMLNSIGLQGKGIIYTMARDVPEWQNAHQLPLFLSLSATSEEEFALVARYIEAHANRAALSAIELNVSCPNVHAGGALFGSSPEWVGKAVKAVASETRLPLWVKLSPNAPDVLAVAETAVKAGATGLTAINTVMGAHVDIRRRKPSLNRISGGYSGPGIKPIAIHHLLSLKRALPETPMIGVGGITNAEDVLEFLMAGASAVQVGTQCFTSPAVFPDILQQLEAWCEAEGVSKLGDIVGVAL